MIQNAIQKLVNGNNLLEEEAMNAMSCIMDGNATPAQIGSFITALRIKGETIEEITGCAKVMREKAERIHPDVGYFIDTCGTGGDGANTFNISTASAMIAAAGGVTVAKHGNRSVSSKSGSADVLEALGVNLSLTPEQVAKCMEMTGIGFMFAPLFHKSMKHAAGPRKELGLRTIFNVLGPLTNPAGAKGQVLGVFDAKLTEPLAKVLLKLGLEKAMVLHGLDGMDEITLCEATQISEIQNGEVVNYQITPEMFGMERVSREAIVGGDALENAEIIRAIFRGEKGPRRDIAVLNAAAALYVGKKADSMQKGVELAQELIDSGRVCRKLEEFVEITKSFM